MRRLFASSLRPVLAAWCGVAGLALLGGAAPVAGQAPPPPAGVPALPHAPAPSPAPAGRAPVPAPAPAGSEEAVVRVFEIRYRDVSEVAILIQPALSPSVLTVNRATRTITVVDRPEVVRRVEEFIRQFDVPPHAVVVRIVLERAERAQAQAASPEPSRGAAAFQDPAAWRYVHLAETALEVVERGDARQTFGPDGTFEIHVHVESVDAGRGVIRLDDVGLRRLVRAPAAAGVPPTEWRDVLTTGLDLQDRVGKVVMAARDEEAEEALVLRVIGLIRESEAGGR